VDIAVRPSRRASPLLGVACVLAVTAMLPAREFDDLDGSSIAWRTDLAAARAEARRANKPLLALFRCVP